MVNCERIVDGGMLYGIDVGGSKIECAVFDEQLSKVNSIRVKTPIYNYHELIDVIVGLVKRADQEYSCMGSVGIGVPGRIQADGTLLVANIPSANGRRIARDLSEAIARPVGVENDLRTFLLSESIGGAASSVQYALGMILGTGLSGGLCINGSVYCGSQQIAGEIGHTPLPAILQSRYRFPLRKCGCGFTGCIEMYLSGRGLKWISDFQGAQYESVPELVAGANANESKAYAVLECYADCLSCLIGQMVLTIDPDLIFFGGGLSRVSQLYLMLPDIAKSYMLPGTSVPPIVPARFGDASGTRGAAIVGSNTYISKQAG